MVRSGASISADGHYLVYQSNASGGHSEIYLYDLTTGQVVFHTADASGGSYNPVVSPDGHFIIFASDARLTANDINSVADTYVVDVTDPSSPHFKLVSALADGTQGDAGSNLGAAISTGGMYIAFGSSASNFFSVDGPGGNIFVVDPTSGRSAIINETASSPSILTASGTIVLSGDHTGTTIGVSGDPATFSASFDNDGNIQWTFSEAKSDFAALAYGQDAVQQFNITLTHGADHTTIPVTIAVHNAIQTVTTESLAFDTGASAIDHITSNGTLGGTGLANTAVHFTIDGSAIGATATADAQGAWSFTPTGLADGAHTIVASQTDVFGNAHTASLSFTLDTTAPAAATPDLAVGSDTGSSNSDNVTSAIAPSFTLALGPTVVAGDTVQLLLGGSPLAHPVTRTVTVAEVIAGSVSLVVTAGDLGADGVKQISAQFSDLAGNSSTTGALSVTLDTAAPTEALAITAIASDSGSSSSDFITNDTTLTVSGTNGALAAGEKIQVSSDGGATWTDVVQNTSTSWSLTDGTSHPSSFTYQARIVDIVDTAGNVGSTASQVVTIDTAAPSGATPDLTTASDSGTSSSDNVTSITAPSFTVAFAPTVVAGDTVELLLGGSPLAHPVTHTITAAEVTAGSVSLAVTAGDLGADGVKQISAQFSDLAGNSLTTGALSVTLNTAAPAETLAITAIASDTGSSSSDFITSDTTLTVSGTNGALSAGEKIQLSSDGGTTWTDVIQNTSTSWSLADGISHPSSFTYQARIVDTAGNIGTAASQAVTIDTAAPAEALAITAIASDTGSSSSDFITSDTSLTVSGTNGALAAGEKIQVSSDGGTTWTDVVQNDLDELELGRCDRHPSSFTYQARIVDTAGNIGTAASQAVTIDTAAPVVAIGNPGGATNQPSLILTGTITGADAGTTIAIFDGVTQVGVANISGGTWSANVTLNNGANLLTAQVVDAAGNTATSGAVTYTLNTTAPTGGTPDLVAGSDTGSSNSDNITSVTAPSFTVALGATVVAGDTVELLLGGSPLAHPVTHTVTAAEVTAGSVNLAVTVGDLGADGVKQISARLSDGLGNSSTTGALSVTLDTTAPAETLAITAIASDSGSSSSDFITSDTTLTVSGTNGALAAGEKIQVSSDGGTTWTDVIQNTSTSWSLADGISAIHRALPIRRGSSTPPAISALPRAMPSPLTRRHRRSDRQPGWGDQSAEPDPDRNNYRRRCRHDDRDLRRRDPGRRRQYQRRYLERERHAQQWRQSADRAGR